MVIQKCMKPLMRNEVIKEEDIRISLRSHQ